MVLKNTSVISKTFDIYKDNLNIIFPYLVGVIVASVIRFIGIFTTFILTTIGMLERPIPIPSLPPYEILYKVPVFGDTSLLSYSMFVTFVSSFIAIVIMIIAEGMVVLMCKDAIEKGTTTTEGLVDRIKPKLGPLIIASLILAILIALVGAIPMIGGLLRSLLKTVLSGVPVLVVLGNVSPIDLL